MTTRLRALPLRPPPVHGETIGSYLNRLADANHLTIGHLSSLIGPSRQHRRDDNRVGYWTPEGLSRLAALTSRSPASLIHAMPPLGTIGNPIRRLPLSATEEVIEPRRRPACRPCMARRHVRGLVIRSTPHHEGVCHRHRRWLLGDEQHRLTRLPEVLQANRQHQRIARRGTHPSTALAYVGARDRLVKWFTNEVGSPLLRQRWNRRLDALGEDPFGDPHHPSETRIELVAYPEVVVLTGLFASPHWRNHPRLLTETAQRFGIAPQELPSDLGRKRD
ncbi:MULTISPECIES: TniQ family protein [Streptomyces]|uniref:TniQ family protein n=2 Tax=Streptomyces TaxID=1883 RepID=A0A927KYJ7_9ACTN|nr:MULTISPECIES: TniQ family protein [Streptomyces]MBD9702072.1 TniQ family protein [Streptomyces caniscabiei]MBD9722765.1 TniQ family protein [Streptomyces caniscabiei]MBE4738834.1 TniQ family protein [Streptomyces caniscabiei]MBE4758026.1 TniQ family protein [Streptomyces caniscabiei]MBE4787687.1 TniQ family protein [Streptomyces caniscabiei]